MNKLLLAFMMPVCICRLFSQDGTPGTLSFVNTGFPSFSSYADPGTAAHVRRIYDRLIQAPGKRELSVPRLEISQMKYKAAYFNHTQRIITIEEEAIQACRRFGDAAIAFLLGHELAHHTENHGWRNEIGPRFGRMAADILPKVPDAQKIIWEAEADIVGGFRVYLAGFGFFYRADDLLDEIYRVYNLPDSVQEYPPLAQRKELIRFSTNRLEQLIDALEMANLLTVAGFFQEAHEFYNYVYKEYQSHELLNNMGVALVLDVLDSYPEYYLNYVLPIQIQMKYRSDYIRARSPDMPAQNIPPGQDKLHKAITFFEQAKGPGNNYAPAFLNQACVYALLRDFRRARFMADVEAREKAGNNAKTLADIEVLLAIIDATTGEYDSARQRLQAAVGRGSRLAEANLRILNGERSPPPNNKPVFEVIDHQSISQAISNARRGDGERLQISGEYHFYHNPEHGPNSTLMMCENVRSNRMILFHFTHRNYPGTSGRGISIGSTERAVIQAYGIPVRELETPAGRILRYGSLLFIIDSQGMVERWVNFALL